MNVYEEALLKARIFGCRVAIVHNGNDGPGIVWETVTESNDGGFPHAGGRPIADIVSPIDAREITI